MIRPGLTVEVRPAVDPELIPITERPCVASSGTDHPSVSCPQQRPPCRHSNRQRSTHTDVNGQSRSCKPGVVTGAEQCGLGVAVRGLLRTVGFNASLATDGPPADSTE